MTSWKVELIISGGMTCWVETTEKAPWRTERMPECTLNLILVWEIE